MKSFITKSIFFKLLVAILLIAGLLPVSGVQAQGTGYLEVVGSVYKDSKNLEGADILVMKGNEKVDQISTNAGGLAEINIQGETGFLTDVGDVEAMSGYAISLLKDEVKLETMKEAAYQQALRFDITNIIPVYEKLYSQYCRRVPCK